MIEFPLPSGAALLHAGPVAARAHVSLMSAHHSVMVLPMLTVLVSSSGASSLNPSRAGTDQLAQVPPAPTWPLAHSWHSGGLYLN